MVPGVLDNIVNHLVQPRIFECRKPSQGAVAAGVLPAQQLYEALLEQGAKHGVP